MSAPCVWLRVSQSDFFDTRRNNPLPINGHVTSNCFVYMIFCQAYSAAYEDTLRTQHHVLEPSNPNPTHSASHSIMCSNRLTPPTHSASQHTHSAPTALQATMRYGTLPTNATVRARSMLQILYGKLVQGRRLCCTSSGRCSVPRPGGLSAWARSSRRTGSAPPAQRPATSG